MASRRLNEHPNPTGRRGLLARIATLYSGTAPALVEADAGSLIEIRGAGAYGVTRSRARQIDQGRLVDESRRSGHWRAVSRRVAELVGHEIGLDNATRRLND